MAFLHKVDLGSRLIEGVIDWSGLIGLEFREDGCWTQGGKSLFKLISSFPVHKTLI